MPSTSFQEETHQVIFALYSYFLFTIFSVYFDFVTKIEDCARNGNELLVLLAFNILLSLANLIVNCTVACRGKRPQKRSAEYNVHMEPQGTVPQDTEPQGVVLQDIDSQEPLPQDIEPQGVVPEVYFYFSLQITFIIILDYKLKMREKAHYNIFL